MSSDTQKFRDELVKIRKIVDNVIAYLTEYEKILEKDLHAPGIPQIDLAELDQAPWFDYKTKQQAEPGTAAWTKNPAGWPGLQLPEVLVELSKALTKLPDHTLILGLMEYDLSKPDAKGASRFINRKPAKKEK
jgi:hypothetical protein